MYCTDPKCSWQLDRKQERIKELESGLKKPEYIAPVWCCEKRHKCKWQGFALHKGLAWGTPEDPPDEWLAWHKNAAGG